MPEGNRAPAADGGGRTVLLVEDDPAVRRLVAEVLEDLRYRTLEAAEAEAAIALLRSDRAIDLMVTDVGLPGMDGRGLAEAARSFRPALPILFVTGDAEQAAIAAGPGTGVIAKPFAIDELAARMQALLG